MRILWLSLSLLLWTGVWAQEASVREIRQNVTFLLRAAEQPCPEVLRPLFPGATCSRHGYNDFFVFKEAATSYLAGFGGRLEPWRVVTLTVDGETAEAFQARYHPRGNAEPLVVTWLSETLFVLGIQNVRPSP